MILIWLVLTIFELSWNSILASLPVLLLDLVVVCHDLRELTGERRILQKKSIKPHTHTHHKEVTWPRNTLEYWQTDRHIITCWALPSWKLHVSVTFTHSNRRKFTVQSWSYEREHVWSTVPSPPMTSACTHTCTNTYIPGLSWSWNRQCFYQGLLVLPLSGLLVLETQ